MIALGFISAFSLPGLDAEEFPFGFTLVGIWLFGHTRWCLCICF